MTTTTQWYLDMAKAIQARDHALNMVERWQGKAFAAEQEIQNLAAQAGSPSLGTIEQVQEYVQ